MSEKGKIPFGLLWGIVMSLAYAGIAWLVAFTPLLLRYNAYNDPQQHDENGALRAILAIIFFAYGIVRGYTTWVKFRSGSGGKE